MLGRISFLLLSPPGKRDYESLTKFIETGEFEEHEETVSDFDDDEIHFEDLDTEKENEETKEESEEEADVIDEIKEKKRDEL